MTERPTDHCDILIVGGGAAGVAAAASLAARGFSVELVEQRAALGGAFHRQPASGAALGRHDRRRLARWSSALGALASAGTRIRLRHGFLGLDGDGLALIENRETHVVFPVRARAIILAVGALERIRPRPGWQLGGVMTAGGLQMLLKESGRVPDGDILIAGTGPLTLALAADLARAGRPAIAVVEAGDPFAHPASALRLIGHPGLMFEAAGHLARLALAPTRWLRGASLTAVEKRDGRLVATILERRGGHRRIGADIVALHDGIRPNDFGLPSTGGPEPYVVRAGDCREALGIRAAGADGVRAAAEVAAALAGHSAPREDGAVARQRRLQATLGALFAPVRRDEGLAALPDDTVICRCEGRTAGELRALLSGPDLPGLREIKLNGRFGMGVCQGRFCSDVISELAAPAHSSDTTPAPLRGRDRWPLRPVTISALTAQDRDMQGD